MNIFISWRLSRLLKGEAWKRACSLEGIISLVCLLTLIFCLHWGTIPDKTVYWFMVGGVIGFAWLVLDKVLGADDCFQVKTMNGPCKVWVYVLRGERMQYKIVLKTKDWEKICIANAYDRDIFAGTKDAFIFNPNFEGYSDAWRFVGEDFSSVETIGVRVSKYVFADLLRYFGNGAIDIIRFCYRIFHIFRIIINTTFQFRQHSTIIKQAPVKRMRFGWKPSKPHLGRLGRCYCN